MNIKRETGHVAVERMNMHFDINMFGNEGVEPTIVLIVNFGDKILLSQSADAPVGWWCPPQGHIEPRHGTLMGALRRTLVEKLGVMGHTYTATTARFLGEHRNPIPRERGVTARVKHLHFVGVKLNMPAICLNRRYIADSRWVSSWSELDRTMGQCAEERVLKYVWTCEALMEAQRHNLLPWPNPVRRHAPAAMTVTAK